MTKYDLSSLRYCTIAGEALNPAVFETFKKLTGIKLYVYGFSRGAAAARTFVRWLS